MTEVVFISSGIILILMVGIMQYNYRQFILSKEKDFSEYKIAMKEQNEKFMAFNEKAFDAYLDLQREQTQPQQTQQFTEPDPDDPENHEVKPIKTADDIASSVN